MRIRLIILCGLTLSIIGVILGLAVAKIQEAKHQCCYDIINTPLYPGFSKPRKPRIYYGVVGAIVGLIAGSSFEIVRQQAKIRNEGKGDE